MLPIAVEVAGAVYGTDSDDDGRIAVVEMNTQQTKRNRKNKACMEKKSEEDGSHKFQIQLDEDKYISQRYRCMEKSVSAGRDKVERQK